MDELRIERQTPTGRVLSMVRSALPRRKWKVAAGLVTDRLFDITNEPGANASGELSYDQIAHAVEVMLNERTLRVEVIET